MNDYILWLPSWYPNQLTPFDGDFIQRHARAAALYRPVRVIHVIRDEKGSVTKGVHIEERREGQLHETIVYYYVGKSLLPGWDKWISYIRYRELYRQITGKFMQQWGKPALVHVHIAFKAGLEALELFRKEGIPYLLTEQWTAYLPEAKPNWSMLPFYQRRVVSRVVEGAAAVLPVSAYLAKAMQLHWPKKRYEVVPNVVDLQLFQPDPPQPSQKLRLIHISNLNYQKDPESLFQSLRRLSEKGIDWELDVLGPDSEEVNQRCRQLGIDGQVHFHGEVPHPILVRFLQRSDALVLYSRYETFGCVLIEAFACGVPVIVSDTDLMKEIVEEGITGYRVLVNNPEALAHAFEKLNQSKFLPERIVEEARKYRFETIGKRMEEIYQEFERK